MHGEFRLFSSEHNAETERKKKMRKWRRRRRGKTHGQRKGGKGVGAGERCCGKREGRCGGEMKKRYRGRKDRGRPLQGHGRGLLCGARRGSHGGGSVSPVESRGAGATQQGQRATQQGKGCHSCAADITASCGSSSLFVEVVREASFLPCPRPPPRSHSINYPRARHR